MILFLNGYSGVGKTYFGKVLSQHLGVPHIDLDEEIVKFYNCSINEMFQRYGEDTFRGRELLMLEKLISQNKSQLILSLGGGTACNFSGLQLTKSKGILCYMTTTFDQISSNLEALSDERPRFKALLEVGGVPTLRRDFDQRQFWYDQSQVHFEAKNAENLVKSRFFVNLLTL
jgi:shikimate kinase